MIRDLLDLVKREKMAKTRKRIILGLIIEIGAAVAIGATAGINLALRTERKKQMNMNSESEVDTIENTVRNDDE